MSLLYEPCKFLDSPPRPLERWIYRLARVDLQPEMIRRRNAFQHERAMGQRFEGEKLFPPILLPLTLCVERAQSILVL